MSGAFATIEKKTTSQGQCLAYKTYSKFHGNLVYQHYKRELWALTQLKIKTIEQSREVHVLFLSDSLETANSYQLVFPFYPKTLQHVLEDQENRTSYAHQLLKQVGKGLLFLHSQGLIHCDLSPSNILMDENNQMFISDFGCAHSSGNIDMIDKRKLDFDEIGTRYYKAPEHLFNYKIYSPATDIWSLGAILFQLLIGYPGFNGETDIEQIGRIKFRLGHPSIKVKTEEMTAYPDFNKLMFFNDDSDDESDIEYDSIEEYEEIVFIRKSLEEILLENEIPDVYCKVISGALTWSIHERIPLAKILELFT